MEDEKSFFSHLLDYLPHITVSSDEENNDDEDDDEEEVDTDSQLVNTITQQLHSHVQSFENNKPEDQNDDDEGEDGDEGVDADEEEEGNQISYALDIKKQEDEKDEDEDVEDVEDDEDEDDEDDEDDEGDEEGKMSFGKHSFFN
jgi:hypothetical protein